ncbi:efflux RND transporter periplasmic adaptor subunit [Asticcacaulis sp. AND118]|uniref:efflux RND transporter periplasmic adaptor subunit n=1 Tax=Asticcacaulis sp. AND118 TaxID=2840468 RepID=UPI001CFFA813|nr:efflux RND transporter periplasmic adaptor subunit [Asticcacaulis sp. AND118]UDF05789.1 efflux RND transporter periplasmic adaptor subunit [Asticcacaulis sp. AND118]
MTRASALALILLLAVPVGLTACSEGHDKASVAAAPEAIGDILTVQTGEIDDVKRVAATLTTRDMGEAVARIGGVLVTLNVREGDTVTKGQVIGVVRDQRLNFEASAYEAVAIQAEADYNRTKGLYDKGIYAKARLEQAEAQYKSAKAQRSAAYELAGQGTVRAPASGKVIKAEIPAGSVVMPGQSIATVTAGPRIVRLTLPEQQARSLVLGQTVSLEANGIAATGTVSQVYPAIDNGQVVADITPQGLDDLLLGERVVTSLSLGQRQGIKVPATYVTTRYGLDYVRLVTADRKVSEVPVQTAPLDGQSVEILSGLKDGDTLAPYGAAQ